MDVVADLRAEARTANERRLLVLSGGADRTRAAAAEALDAAGVDTDAVTYVGTAADTPWERLAPVRAGELLGTTRTAVVLDCHDECRPNALGRAVGAVDGGGLLVVLAPPLDAWPDRRDGFDEGLAVPPATVEDVTGNFRSRLVALLRAHRGVAIVDVDADTDEERVVRDGLTDPAPRRPRPDPAAPDGAAFPDAVYDRCRTDDQADAVATLEKLREGEQAVVVEADRGRGKSSAAGLAAGALALEGRDVLVTAPEYRNAAEVFARAREMLADAGELAGDVGDEGRKRHANAATNGDERRDPKAKGDQPRHLGTADGSVWFERPPEAVETVDGPSAPDALVVDEAAALPVWLLEELLAARSVAFATTVHGYEGTGRGFSVRFRDRLGESDHAVSEVRLAEPVRYAAGDPVETWAFRTLLLDASPPVDPLIEGATPETATYRRLSAGDLLADEHLLREVFGLLVLAHYRTEPDDLARLLDAPNVSVRALAHDGHVVSVALLAREGGLPADLRADMYEGERIRGNMIPDVLTSQLRDEDAGTPVGQRVMRIATHRAVRSRGLGSHLLDRIRAEFGGDATGGGSAPDDGARTGDGSPPDEDVRAGDAPARTDGVDWLGTGYGATPDLVRFWRANGFGAVHLSVTRNEASGEYSAVMLRPTSEAGRELARRHARWFCRRTPGVLSDPLDDADPDVVRETLRSVGAAFDPSGVDTDSGPAFEVDLDDREWRLLAGLPHGASIFDTAPRPLRRLTVRYLVDADDPGESLLSPRQERLLVRKALQGEPWGSVTEELGYQSRAECMRALGAAVEPLLSRYGTDLTRDELERFE